MTEGAPRTGAPRDVPPPRPVPAPASPPATAESPLVRAARAIAEAVAGLAGPDGGRPVGTPVRDVLGAMAAAAAGAFGSAGPPNPADHPGSASGDARTPSALVGDLLAAAAPRLPIRDRARLRSAYPGATDEQIAEALVERAARATSRIGAAAGGLTAAHALAPPTLLAVPVELGVETVLVAAVEVALIGELHELHGRPAAGDAAARAQAYLGSWSGIRGAGGAGRPGVGSLLGAAGVRALRRRASRRMAGVLPSAAPLVGAALSGRENRRATEALARRVLAELRDRPEARGGTTAS